MVGIYHVLSRGYHMLFGGRGGSATAVGTYHEWGFYYPGPKVIHKLLLTTALNSNIRCCKRMYIAIKLQV